MKLTTTQKREQKENSLATLKNLVQEGDTIYTSLQSVSSTGMSRRLNIFIVKDNNIVNITWHVANVLEYRYNDQKESLVIGGCGMDMGYHVVYSLSSVLGYKKSGMGNENTGNCYGLNHKWL